MQFFLGGRGVYGGKGLARCRGVGALMSLLRRDRCGGWTGSLSQTSRLMLDGWGGRRELSEGQSWLSTTGYHILHLETLGEADKRP